MDKNGVEVQGMKQLTEEMKGIEVYVSNTSENKIPVEITSIASDISGVDSIFKNVSFFNDTIKVLHKIDSNLASFSKEFASIKDIDFFDEASLIENLILLNDTVQGISNKVLPERNTEVIVKNEIPTIEKEPISLEGVISKIDELLAKDSIINVNTDSDILLSELRSLESNLIHSLNNLQDTVQQQNLLSIEEGASLPTVISVASEGSVDSNLMTLLGSIDENIKAFTEFTLQNTSKESPILNIEEIVSYLRDISSQLTDLSGIIPNNKETSKAKGAAPLGDTLKKDSSGKDSSQKGFIDKLITSILTKRQNKKAEKAKLNPKEDDLLKATTLETAVPTGFLLLHNDLLKLISPGKGKKASTIKSSAKGGFAGAGLSALGGAAGAAVGGFVAGAVGSLFDAGDTVVDDHYQEIIKELSLELDADQLREDPQVKTQVREGFLSYLKTYFIQKNAALLGSTLGDTVASLGAGIGEGIRNMLGSFLGVGGGETDKLQSVIDDIVATIDSADYIGDPEVEEINHKSVISYLKTYYGTQIASMAAGDFIENTVSSLGSAIGGFVNGMFTSLFGKKQETSPLQAIIDKIVASINVDSYAQDEEILAINNTAIKDYLKAYYNTQIYKLNVDGYASGTTENLGGAVGGFLNNAITSLFGRNKIDEDLAPVQSIIDAIVDSINPESFLGDDTLGQEVKAINNTAIKDYLKAYYNTQIYKLNVDGYASGTTENLGGAVGGFLNNMVTSLFGRNKVEEDLAPIQAIIDKIVESIKVEDYIGNPEVLAANKEGILGYLKAYYNAQTFTLYSNYAGDTLQTTMTSFGAGLGGSIKSFFSTLFTKEESKDKTTQVNKVQSIIDAILGSIKTEDYISDPDVLAANKESILNYLKVYYQIQAESAASQLKAENRSDALKQAAADATDFLSSLLPWNWGNNKEEAKENPIITAVNSIIQNDTTDYVALAADSTSTVEDIKKTIITNTVSTYYSSLLEGFDTAIFEYTPTYGGINLSTTNATLESKVVNAISSLVNNLSFTTDDYNYDTDFINTIADNYFDEASKKGAMQAVKWKDPSSGWGETDNEKTIVSVNESLETLVVNKIHSVITGFNYSSNQTTALKNLVQTATSNILSDYLETAREELSSISFTRSTGFTNDQIKSLNSSLITALQDSLTNTSISTSASFNMESRTPTDDPLLISSQNMEEQTRNIYEYMKVMNETLVTLAQSNGKVMVIPTQSTTVMEDPSL